MANEGIVLWYSEQGLQRSLVPVTVAQWVEHLL